VKKENLEAKIETKKTLIQKEASNRKRWRRKSEREKNLKPQNRTWRPVFFASITTTAATPCKNLSFLLFFFLFMLVV
jgi:hypothetical protein